jgi:hypothetical protein
VPSTREIRRRIRSVGNMQQITRAMEMVSAAKMRKAQQRVTASRPYSDQLRQIMSDLGNSAARPRATRAIPAAAKAANTEHRAHCRYTRSRSHRGAEYEYPSGAAAGTSWMRQEPRYRSSRPARKLATIS